MANKATHIRLKNNKKVVVERHEGPIFVVKSKQGKHIGSYGPEQDSIRKFYQRYDSLNAKRAGE